MFGEKILAGKQTVSIDNKHRISLPSHTGREHGEEIFFVYDEDIEKYILYSKKAFEEKISKLEELVLCETDKQKKLQYKLLLYRFYESVIKKCLVDSHGRILLGDTFDAGEIITTVGAKDHLILVRNNEKK